MKTDKWVAYYGANNEHETFDSFEKAKGWLEDQYDEDRGEGFSEETCCGEDFIAKITHRSKFVETANREKDGYKWNEEAQGYFINGDSNCEEWLYSDEIDCIGNVILEEVCHN
jgi:hypothetical protein